MSEYRKYLGKVLPGHSRGFRISGATVAVAADNVVYYYDVKTGHFEEFLSWVVERFQPKGETRDDHESDLAFLSRVGVVVNSFCY